MSVLLSIAHKKGFSLDSGATVFEAMESMLQNGSGTTVLLDNSKPIGIVTESLLIEKMSKGLDFNLPVIRLARTSLITIHKSYPIESAFDLMVSNNIRRLIVIDDKGNFCGVVLQENLFDFLEDDVYKIDLKVKDLLVVNREVITILESKSIQESSVLMHAKHIGSIIVCNKEGTDRGIITEKDILSAGYKRIDMQESVQRLMSSPVLSVSNEDAVTDVISLMKEKGIRRVLIKDENQRICGLLTNRDIFHHIKGNVARMLEIKLRHAKEIMNLLPEAIIEIFDLPQRQSIHWMNHQAKELFGEIFLDASPANLLGKESWEKLYGMLKDKGTIQGVLVVIHQKSFEFSGTISQNINNRYIKLIIQDITEHEATKQKLQDEVAQESKLRQENEYLMMQQSRMASMGEMVGHIAHQWRQPLAQLGGVFMNLESAYSFGEFDKKYLDEKVQQGNDMITYMSETIDDFRLFFAPEQEQESFDLVLYVKRAVNIVLASLNYHHIEVIIEGDEGEYFAVGLPNEFAQSILNLLNNARDALSKEEKIERKIHIIFKKNSQQTSILFCDNGGGISSSILPILFEPYVTEKQMSGGSGAGLYITRLIIEQKMGGTIEAYNQKRGACFKITLYR